MKTVLYYLMLLTTTIRLLDVGYLLMKDTTNLPGAVLIVTSAMVMYGMVLAAKRFVGSVRLKQLTTFFLVQSAMILFNIIYMAVTCPLQVTVWETIAVGTFLDLLVNCGILYFCSRHSRRSLVTVSVK